MTNVDINDSRLVLTNRGGMNDGSEEKNRDLRHVLSKLRNPILSDVFGRLRLVEKRGSVLKKIRVAYESEERYTEDLMLESYTDRYYFPLTLWNLNYVYDKAHKADLSDKDYLLLLLRENQSVTQTELAAMLNKSRRSVQNMMKQIIEEGVIERVGSKRIGTWIVKQINIL